MKYETVIVGAHLAEGPVWCPDGSLVITQMGPAGLRRIDLKRCSSEVIVSMKGGANAAQLASDGGFLVAQNGGIDFRRFSDLLFLDRDSVVYSSATPGLLRVHPDGRVEYLLDEGFSAPNDLVVARDGTVYFTDPPDLSGGLPGAERNGRLWAWGPGGELRLVAEGFSYDNGVALSPEGRLLIVEAQGLLWIDPESGERDWLVEQLPGQSPGDGFCFDLEGNIYLCCPTDHCVRVLERDGRQVEQIDLGDRAIPTNCCFGGDDRRTLFTTELAPGRVLALVGMPLVPWPTPEGASPRR